MQTPLTGDIPDPNRTNSTSFSSKSLQKPNQINSEGPLHTVVLKLENATKPKGKWNERAHNAIYSLEQKLEERMPPNKVQKVLDAFYDDSIKPLLRKGNNLNAWIDKDNYGAWYKNLTSFILKLPLRSIKNLINFTYNIIKGTVFAFVHPIKAALHLGHFFIEFVVSLTKPETYTKYGAGIMGAAAGTSVYSFGHATIIGLAVGGALIGIGLVSGALKSGIQAEKGEKLNAIKDELWKQIKSIPECALTGFIIGVTFGGIQHAVNLQAAGYQPTATEAKSFVNEVFHTHGVHLDPSAYNITIDPEGTISVTFSGPHLEQNLINLHHHGMISDIPNNYAGAQSYTIEFHNPESLNFSATTNVTIEYNDGLSHSIAGYESHAVPSGLHEMLYPEIPEPGEAASALGEFTHSLNAVVRVVQPTPGMPPS